MVGWLTASERIVELPPSSEGWGMFGSQKFSYSSADKFSFYDNEIGPAQSLGSESFADDVTSDYVCHSRSAYIIARTHSHVSRSYVGLCSSNGT